MCQIAALIAAVTLAAPPNTTVLQGRASSTAGESVDGEYDFVIKAWDAETGGSVLWSGEFNNQQVTDGVFALALTDLPLDVLAGDAAIWIGVAIEGDPELPRKQIASQPFALVAGRSLDLSCSGCITSDALDEDVVALIKAAAEAGYTDGEAVAAVIASDLFYTKIAGGISAGLLPADGLDEVSGGLLSTTFKDTFASNDTPLDIKDQHPIGSTSTISIPDVGVAKSFEVSFELTEHSDLGEVKVSMFSPGGNSHVLYNKTSPGETGLTLTLNPANKNGLDVYVDTNIEGDWLLNVIDDKFDTNTVDGKLLTWHIAITTLSNQKLQFTGDMYGNGKQIKDLGAPTDGTDAANKAYVDASFKDRVFTKEIDGLAAGGNTTLSHGAGTNLVFAQAWFKDLATGEWSLTGSSVSGEDLGDGSSGAFKPQSDTTLSGGTHNFTEFEIPAGVNVTVTGLAPLIVRSKGPLTIAGTLSLNGKDGQTITSTGPNAAGGAGGGGGGGKGGKSDYGGSATQGSGLGGGQAGGSGSYGGGAGGGGHASAGEASKPAPCSTGSNGAGGSAFASLDADILAGGSGGGGGGYGGAANSAGGGGGGGGGAIKMVAPSVQITGTINANGGKGGDVTNDRDGGGGGGGAGGAIWIVSGSVLISGTVSALPGAAGITDKQGCYGSDGGKGGVGRIRIDAFSISGATTPPATSGSNTIGTSGTPLRVFQPDTNTVAVQNLSFVPLDVKLLVIVP